MSKKPTTVERRPVSEWETSLGRTKPFSLLTMTDACYQECPFVPRNDTMYQVQNALDAQLMKKVNTRIEDIETAKKLPEYNVIFAVDVATTVNYMPLMSHDDRVDEAFLADDLEPVSF
jgi:hypothetical protein